MSKATAKWKNVPAAHSADEVVPPTPPESGTLEMRSAAPLLTAQEAGGSVLLPPPPEGQQEVAAQLRQLGQLLASAAQLVARMSLAGFQQNVAMAAGVPAISSTSADPANSLPGPALPANDFTDATQHLRAISADVHLLLTAAPVPLAPDVGNDLFKCRCLPPVRQFTALGEDWMAF
ncbi:unnamed protein product [Lampetra planeri]